MPAPKFRVAWVAYDPLVELDLIARIAARLAVRPGVAVGIGDDAAVLDTDPPLVISTDMLVEGQHFRRDWTSDVDLGHKALAVNLSDLAAMGARPILATVALGIPSDGTASDGAIERLYDGMEALASEHGLTIAGGDITGAPCLVISVTVIGQMELGHRPLLRSGAVPGDLICVTGSLGAARAGLMILDEPNLRPVQDVADALTLAHRRPTPRIAAGRVLATVGARAAMDISDGLALDADRMARASGVRIRINLDQLPIADGVAVVANAVRIDADLLAATAGDDYELVFAAPESMLASIRSLVDVPVTAVGRVEVGPPGVVLKRNGTTIVPASLGWEHAL